ncbi:exosporium glycoprotein BclB-related protein [Paenibacillus endophyticus]|uniref:exosporium glycoprotein BclB-related protein n=1 Tax=Paenibacillus endophyticus TaxID=1294268 RepID=UPI0039EFD030
MPYASGTVTPVVLVSTIAGLVDTTSLVGFGSSVPGVSLAGLNITDPLLAPGYAFTIPQAGTITSISADLSILIALALIGGTATVTAQLYRAPAGSNVFAPLPGVLVTLPTITTVAIGDVLSGITTGLAVPVLAQDRLILVYSVTTTGLTIITTVTGLASAGVYITLSE